MKKTSFSIPFLLLVLILCISLPVCTLIFGVSGPGANEVQSSAPSFTHKDGSFNDNVLSDAAAWFSDHFAFRQELITAYNKAVSAVFRQSAAEDVILGKDGWLFYASTLEDYCREDPMSARQLYAAANNLQLMQEYCDGLGAKFLFTVVPNKNTLYAARMPYAADTSRPGNFDSLYALCEDVNTLDLRNPFLHQEEELYFAHDSHWNSKGAALGADLILAALGEESSYFSDAFHSSAPHSGDLYEMLYPAAADPETDPVYSGSLSYEFAKNSGTRPDSITIRTTGTGEGHLLLYRDSFGNLLYPYLADHFGSAVFSRNTVYDLSAVESGDYVVIEIVERNLPVFTANPPVMPAPVRMLTQLALLGTADTPVEAGKSPMEGYVQYTGTAVCDDHSPVYLIGANGSYQAFLLSDGRFSAHIPEEETITAVACYIGGQLTVLQIP